MAGLALSFITPNRIGEYPARILVLRMNNTIRLISVAILGAFAQFAALFLFGLAGLLYYNIAFPGNLPQVALIACLMLLLVVFLLFFYFEKWIAWFESARWLKRFRTYSQLVRRFTIQQQLTVLGLSILRFTVFTLQYLLLLRWMHIALPPADGFLMASLYFWSIAVIPSMAFTDLGVRGHVSLFLFQHFTANSLGILTATLSLWCINLLLPAVLGSLLLLKIRLIR